MTDELWARPRRDIEARVGSVADLVGPRLLVADDGPGRGNRFVQLRSGSGLEVTVNLDRGMELRDLWWRGRPIHFASSTGDTTPAMFDSAGAGWMRTFAGGLLVTCGLRNVGTPAVVDGEALGMHGRITASAASGIEVSGRWEGDRFVSVIAGHLREATVAGEHLELRREVRVVAGEARVAVRDVIRNAGFRPEPVFVVYHCNLGWPLLDEGSQLHIAGDDPEDTATGVPERSWRVLPGPAAPPSDSQVLLHVVPGDEEGWAHATVTGRPSGSDNASTTLRIGWRPNQLPWLTQWRCMMAGSYVLGLEPGNCSVFGREAELAAGRGEVLEPGEAKEVELTFDLR